MKSVNVMQIGIGFHAKRIYIPAIVKFSKTMPVRLCAGVDVRPARSSIEKYLNERSIEIDMLYLDMYEGNELPESYRNQLDILVERHGINAVIISTDPIAHKMFASWALDRQMNILMDKPISTRSNVSSSENEAKALITDYEELYDKYHALQKDKNTVFSVMVQRRYEKGYEKVFELIKEVGMRFNAPVTSIQASHSDGVWIFPDEVVDQISHPYSTGYGKCSHSGYHIFDIIWQFYKASGVVDKAADSGEVMTSFVSPRGLLQQFGQNDFESYFSDYNTSIRRSEAELWDLFDRYGEIDAFSIIRLLKNRETICNISTNLIHNGFSRRSWVTPNDDLYKGNGRVKHQTYSIQQGPFQNIQIHQYQSEDKHDIEGDHDDLVGGNNHFDIYVFRNSAMFGPDEPAFIKYSPKEFDADNVLDSKRLHNESAKDTVIIEFLECILGRIDKSSLRSSIESHELPVKIMSSIYQSQAQQVKGASPLARFIIQKDV